MNISSAIRCILFDAVGTLIHADPPVSVIYTATAREFGRSMDEATVGYRFAQAFERAYKCARNDDITSESVERDRWRQIVADVFPEIVPSEPLFERLWTYFARPESWRLFDDVAACWQCLAGRNVSLGIASNFDTRLLAICRGHPLLDQCQQVFVSSRIGFRKPAFQFFRAIEQTVGLEPRQLMLIGDDWDSDYRAATAAGWHAVYIDRGAMGRPRRPSGPCPSCTRWSGVDTP